MKVKSLEFGLVLTLAFSFLFVQAGFASGKKKGGSNIGSAPVSQNEGSNDSSTDSTANGGATNTGSPTPTSAASTVVWTADGKVLRGDLLTMLNQAQDNGYSVNMRDFITFNVPTAIGGRGVSDSQQKAEKAEFESLSEGQTCIFRFWLVKSDGTRSLINGYISKNSQVVKEGGKAVTLSVQAKTITSKDPVGFNQIKLNDNAVTTDAKQVSDEMFKEGENVVWLSTSKPKENYVFTTGVPTLTSDFAQLFNLDLSSLNVSDGDQVEMVVYLLSGDSLGLSQVVRLNLTNIYLGLKLGTGGDFLASWNGVSRQQNYDIFNKAPGLGFSLGFDAHLADPGGNLVLNALNLELVPNFDLNGDGTKKTAIGLSIPPFVFVQGAIEIFGGGSVGPIQNALNTINDHFRIIGAIYDLRFDQPVYGFELSQDVLDLLNLNSNGQSSSNSSGKNNGSGNN